MANKKEGHHHYNDEYFEALATKSNPSTIHQHHHHSHNSKDNEYFEALATKSNPSTKHQHHHHSHQSRDDEYFGALAKKSPKDHLHLFALDGMRASLPIIRAIISAVVILRLMLIAMSVIFGRYYVTRQIEYTIAWIMILAFAFTYNPNIDNIEDIKIYIKRMRTISLLASLACALKAIVTLVYNWDLFAIQAWMTAYSALEIAAWLALSVFFAMFWRYWHRQRKKLHDAVKEENRASYEGK